MDQLIFCDNTMHYRSPNSYMTWQKCELLQWDWHYCHFNIRCVKWTWWRRAWRKTCYPSKKCICFECCGGQGHNGGSGRPHYRLSNGGSLLSQLKDMVCWTARHYDSSKFHRQGGHLRVCHWNDTEICSSTSWVPTANASPAPFKKPASSQVFP